MKYLNLLLLSVLLLSINSLAVNAKEIYVPDGTRVPFTANETFTSKDINNNTKIPVTVAGDVYYDNYLIFKKGSQGYIYPSYVNKAGMFGKNGQINFENVYLYDTNSTQQILSSSYEYKGKKVIYGTFGFFSKSAEASVGPGNLMYGKTIGTIKFDTKSKSL